MNQMVSSAIDFVETRREPNSFRNQIDRITLPDINLAVKEICTAIPFKAITSGDKFENPHIQSVPFAEFVLDGTRSKQYFGCL
jgi:hypothetical protein